MNRPQHCPCQSNKPYVSCCGQYHEGAPAPTPLALMRSRYSAYALGNVDYIIATATAVTNREDVERFINECEFKELEILDSEEGELEGTVTFIATFIHDNHLVKMKEKSLFQKENGKWFYVSGDVEFLN